MLLLLWRRIGRDDLGDVRCSPERMWLIGEEPLSFGECDVFLEFLIGDRDVFRFKSAQGELCLGDLCLLWLLVELPDFISSQSLLFARAAVSALSGEILL